MAKASSSANHTPQQQGPREPRTTTSSTVTTNMSANQWYFSEQDLKSHATEMGMKWEDDNDYRRQTVMFMEQLGQNLDHSKLTICSAHVFFHRFFLRQSFRAHDRLHVGVACMFLAGKVEECPKRLSEVVGQYFELRSSSSSRSSLSSSVNDHSPDDQKAVDRMKERIIINERIILHTLAFDMVIVHPHGIMSTGMVKFLHKLPEYVFSTSEDKATVESSKTKAMKIKKITQLAWNFTNDSFATTLCLQYRPKEIAMALAYLAIVYAKIIPKEFYYCASDHESPWWTEFDVPEKHMNDICKQLLQMYVKNSSQLEDGLQKLAETYHTRCRHADENNINSGMDNNNTPTHR